MEQHWSYKVTSERWKGTEAVGLWIDRGENGRKQTENSDLKYCCREHCSGLWWAGPASIPLERRGAGADCLGQAGTFLLCGCAGRSGHICAWQTPLTLPWDTGAASRAALQVPSHDWHELPVPRNAPVSGQCDAVKEGGPCGVPRTTQSGNGGSHSVQQWCQSIPCAVKGPSSYALFAPAVAHRIILKQPVQARCAAIPQEPCPSARCTAQVRTTHQGLVNSSLVNIQNKSACSVKRLKLVQFYTGTAPPSSTATH